MFTEQMFREYFTQILDLERLMMRESREMAAMAEKLGRNDWRDLLAAIAGDEQRHVVLAEELIRLVDEKGS